MLYKIRKLPNFVYICTTPGKTYHFCANFASKVVTFKCVIQICTKLANFAKLFFLYFITFANQLCNFTDFKMLFRAMVVDFVLLA